MIDLRLVDIGGPEDLRMLRWLARHDVRERALAVRKGRLHALRLVRTPAAAAVSGLGARVQRVRALSAACAYSSAARQQYQASTDR